MILGDAFGRRLLSMEGNAICGGGASYREVAVCRICSGGDGISHQKWGYRLSDTWDSENSAAALSGRRVDCNEEEQ